MKFSEFVARNENVKLSDIVPMLQMIYVNAHNWNVDDTIQSVFESKKSYALNNVLLDNIKNNVIDGCIKYEVIVDPEGYPVNTDPFTGEPIPTLMQRDSYVNVKSLVKYIVDDIRDTAVIPNELLIAAGMSIDVTDKNCSEKSDHAISRELGTLRHEKLKWDASIKAATEIGLLFYKDELPKPATMEEFIAEFNSRVGGLPNTTVEMIFKALPEDYKQKTKRKKISTVATGISSEDLSTAIKAAVYAGSLFETPDAKDVKRLTELLNEYEYQIPPEPVLQKIIEAVKAI